MVFNYKNIGLLVFLQYNESFIVTYIIELPVCTVPTLYSKYLTKNSLV